MTNKVQIPRLNASFLRGERPEAVAPATGSASYAPASGSPNYAPASGSRNYAPSTGSPNYLAADAGRVLLVKSVAALVSSVTPTTTVVDVTLPTPGPGQVVWFVLGSTTTGGSGNLTVNVTGGAGSFATIDTSGPYNNEGGATLTGAETEFTFNASLGYSTGPFVQLGGVIVVLFVPD